MTIAGRNAEAGAQVLREMEAAADRGWKEGTSRPVQRFERLDASVLDAVRRFADDFAQREGKDGLDVLVLSQGIGSLAGRTETVEGIDVKLALHYCGLQGHRKVLDLRCS